MKPVKQVFILLLVGGAFVLWQYLERRHADEAGWCRGIPEATAQDLRHGTLVLRNAGFSVGYSEFLGNPLWVAYRLFPPPHAAPRSRPDSGFRRDDRSIRGVAPDAFSSTGFQRGHLAPNYAMYRVHGEKAQQDSFLMTNISPQKPRLNQKAWQRIEEIVMDEMMPNNGPLCVVTGPVFDESPRILHSGVAVPRAFYKILITSDVQPRVLAFLVPQDVTGHEPLDSFLVTIDEIEQLTGLDFLPRLADTAEGQIEGRISENWGLQEVARLPPRY